MDIAIQNQDQGHTQSDNGFRSLLSVPWFLDLVPGSGTWIWYSFDIIFKIILCHLWDPSRVTIPVERSRITFNVYQLIKMPLYVNIYISS